ncbi:glycosyltransferase family 4 protein [Tsuneonella troitsensis]|uniref:glycosyltransferase family 4 protein n=1 Tax=Tsuneonella troitsensis TaxID=292222 RepID=UPI00070C64D9|nr:glycosyltransferase family 1 protein [Tsuneonella troitsensis]
MRICIVTDAWTPQINGVVRTLEATREGLERLGHTVGVVSPADYRSVPCPTYPEIRLALASRAKVGARIEAFAPDALHLATEGPLGIAARSWAQRHGLSFTTAYHTHFPQYLSRRTHMPAAPFWRFIRWFHAPATATLAATEGLRSELASHGVGPTLPWSRGVDLRQFSPVGDFHPAFRRLPGPIMLYVGRIAVEKSVERFLALDVPGTKVVVGDGPARASLAVRFPDAVFLGPMRGAELAAAYRSADVFVFPSSTDTFGLVMVEALACGTPVAALPEDGPRAIVTPECGALSPDLGVAVREALGKHRADCAARARDFGWDAATRHFLAALTPLAAEARPHADAMPFAA